MNLRNKILQRPGPVSDADFRFAEEKVSKAQTDNSKPEELFEVVS